VRLAFVESAKLFSTSLSVSNAECISICMNINGVVERRGGGRACRHAKMPKVTPKGRKIRI